MVFFAVAVASVLMLPPCKQSGTAAAAVSQHLQGDIFGATVSAGRRALEERGEGACDLSGRTLRLLPYGATTRFRGQVAVSDDPDMVHVAALARKGRYGDAFRMLAADGYEARLDVHWSLDAQALESASRGDLARAALLLRPDVVRYLTDPDAYFGADRMTSDQSMTLTPFVLALVDCDVAKYREAERLLYAMIDQGVNHPYPDTRGAFPPMTSASMYLIGELTNASGSFACIGGR